MPEDQNNPEDGRRPPSSGAATPGVSGKETHANTGIDSIDKLERYTEDPGEKRVFGFEPVLVGRILWLSLPVVIGMLTQTAINQIDMAMIGRLPDEAAVAGLAAIMPAQIMLWAFGGFLSAISVGTQALTARRFGGNDTEGAGRVLINSAAVATVTSLIATVIAWNLAGPLFNLNSDDPITREVGTGYLQIRYLGLFSMVLMASYKSFYDGLGRVRIHMVIAIIMNLMNAVLNYFLIFGFQTAPDIADVEAKGQLYFTLLANVVAPVLHVFFGDEGIPALGVDGAAWASVASSMAGVIIMFFWTMRKDDRKTFRAYRLKNFDWMVAKSVTMLSLWSGLAIFFAMSGFWLFFKIIEIGAVGDVTVERSAASIVTSVGLIAFMLCIAYGTATATLISQTLGAGKPDLSYRYGVQSLKVIVLFMSVLGAVAFVIPEQIVALFLGSDTGGDALKPQVIALAAKSLRLCAIGAPMAAFALVTAQSLYGAGESRFVMIVEGALHFTCLVPIAYLFAVTFELGLIGCWLAMGVYGLALIIAMGIKFFGKGWTKTVI